MQAWHQPSEESFVDVRARGEVAVARSSEGTLWGLTIATGERRFELRNPTFLNATISKEGVFVLKRAEVKRGGKFALARLRAETGEQEWIVPVIAGAVKRLTVGGGRVFITAARNRELWILIYDAAHGGEVEALRMGKGRGMIGRGGARIWFRNAEMLREHQLVTRQEFETSIEGNGAMGERGPDLLTVRAESNLCAIRAGKIRWQVRLPSRDLTRLAAEEELLDFPDEEDVWDADLGRPVIQEERVFVADLNGFFHALRLEDGSLAWSFESRAYPSTQLPATPCVVGDSVFAALSDEVLYALSLEGELRSKFPLPGPFEGRLESSTQFALMPFDGVRAFGLSS